MKNKSSLIKITKNFQVTLPVKLRSAFKLEAGDYLEAEVKDGAFVFRPKKLVDINYAAREKSNKVKDASLITYFNAEFSSFDFLKDELDLYDINDLKKKYV